MSWSEVAVVVVLALLVLLWWVWVAANRLDRLHRKVARSRSALENQLVRRASVAVELASSGVMDPVSSVLVGDAAWSALSAGGSSETELAAVLPELPELGEAPGPAGSAGPEGWGQDVIDRDLAESELSRTLRAALSDPEEVAAVAATPLGAELADALAAAWYRLQLARRFHNEAVAQTQRVRRKALVRLLRLPGHAPMPHTVEIDDGWPDALPRPGQSV